MPYPDSHHNPTPPTSADPLPPTRPRASWEWNPHPGRRTRMSSSRSCTGRTTAGRVLVAIAILVLHAGAPPRIAAQQETGAVAGRVVDAAGAPLPGAQVVIEGTNLGALAR